ncbi:MAG: hypothetical protein FJ224_10250 [Lentisphaerae bacterium]|nr:hypothetical protein [Lentisphaerota bacterium]
MSAASVYSSSRRFLVIGPDAAQNMEAGRWAEQQAGTIEKALGFTVGVRRWRCMRLVLLDAADAGGPPVEATQEHDGHQWVYRLIIRGAESAAPGDVGLEFVRMFLSAMIADLRMGLPDSDLGAPPMAPGWIAAGLAGTFDAAGRERHAEVVYFDWERGRIPLLGDFFPAVAGGADPRTEALASMSSMLMRWVQVRPGHGDAFRFLLRVIASDEDCSVKDFAAATGFSSTKDLECGWDEWIMRQRRIVHRPGVTSRLALETLKAQLLLYPGDSGNRLALGFSVPVRASQLIDFKDNTLAREAASGAAVAVRIAAVGRGADCVGAADLYAEYFAAVAKRRARWIQRRLLARAEAAMSDLDRRISGAGPDGKGAGLPR